jgi:hypothetical protein
MIEAMAHGTPVSRTIAARSARCCATG